MLVKIRPLIIALLMAAKKASKVAALAFLAIFPGFYFYHFAVSMYVIPSFLAGWHGPMTLIFAVPLAFSFLAFIFKNRLSVLSDPITLMAGLLLVYTVGWLLINMSLQPNHPGHEELVAAILAMFVYFMTGALLDLDGVRKWLLPCWIIMVLLAVTNVTIGAYMFQTSLETETGSPLYQGLARSFMVVAMAMIALPPGIVARLIVGLFSIAALFVIGARSELYGFILTYAIAELTMSRRNIFRVTMLGLAGLAIALVVTSYLGLLGASRQLLVFDLGADASWNVRNHFEYFARTQIAENPIMGVYGGHWQIEEGGYAHNALSAWVSLGIVGFMLYMALSIVAVTRSFRTIKAVDSAMSRFAFMMALVALVLVIVAKPVFWAFPAMAWALNTRAVRKKLR